MTIFYYIHFVCLPDTYERDIGKGDRGTKVTWCENYMLNFFVHDHY